VTCLPEKESLAKKTPYDRIPIECPENVKGKEKP